MYVKAQNQATRTRAVHKLRLMDVGFDSEAGKSHVERDTYIGVIGWCVRSRAYSNILEFPNNSSAVVSDSEPSELQRRVHILRLLDVDVEPRRRTKYIPQQVVTH